MRLQRRGATAYVSILIGSATYHSAAPHLSIDRTICGRPLLHSALCLRRVCFAPLVLYVAAPPVGITDIAGHTHAHVRMCARKYTRLAHTHSRVHARAHTHAYVQAEGLTRSGVPGAHEAVQSADNAEGGPC